MRLPRSHRAAFTTGLAIVVLTASACSGPEAMLDPGGPAAQRTADLWWFMFALGGTVYLVVMALALIGVVQGRRQQRRGNTASSPGEGAGASSEDERTRVVGTRLILYGGLIGPVIVLLSLNIVGVPLSGEVADRGATAQMELAEDELVIDVTAEKFWWRASYPQYGFETANELHIPAGERVRIRLTSTDVVHSFWIPRLAGKIDATPGHTTEQVLFAEEPGRYRGRCTEFCGLAHAQMVVFVVAQERQEFDAWATRHAEPQPLPTDDRIEEGRQIFMGSSCIYCHAVDGHTPPNTIGPNLTYLAERETLAAGALPNTRGVLGGWVVDPQSQKPGNLMPGTQIAGDELAALLDYLESLR